MIKNITNLFSFSGGTVDVTVHEILKGGKLKEVYKASGGPWGGNRVNQMYEKFIEHIVGSNVLQKVKKHHMSDWLNMMRVFEETKRTLSKSVPEDDDDQIFLRLEHCVNEEYQDFHGLSLQEAFSTDRVDNPQGAVLRKKTILQIPKTVVLDWIQKVAKSVKDHVQELLNRLTDNISFIVMVGGFSNSLVLQEEVKSIIGKIDVFVPEEAQLSVVKGAVLFGWNPKIVYARRSKYTYGIATYTDYIPGVHQPSTRKELDDDNNWKCKIFGKFIEEMQEVKVGDVFVRNYSPFKRNQTSVEIRLYYSTDKNAKYPDDHGVTPVGYLRIPMPDLTGDKSREVKVYITFGETEIHVEGEDVTSGQKVDASFDFLSEEPTDSAKFHGNLDFFDYDGSSGKKVDADFDFFPEGFFNRDKADATFKFANEDSLAGKKVDASFDFLFE